jgi:RNA polymerase sigma-70 factor (ECF subfamily)
MTERDEMRLVGNLRAGRPDACAELVRTHYQAVYRFLVHLTRHVHEAEDLTQETFAAAWQEIDKFEARSTLATWLHRIAYRKYIDAQRIKRRAAGVFKQVTSRRSAPADPLETVATDDDARMLYRALHSLSAVDHAMLVLHYFQGLSYREMAAVLDQPTGTLKWRTAAALLRLRALLSDEVPCHASGKTS